MRAIITTQQLDQKGRKPLIKGRNDNNFWIRPFTLMPNLDRKNKAIAVKAIPTTINGNICMNDLVGFR